MTETLSSTPLAAGNDKPDDDVDQLSGSTPVAQEPDEPDGADLTLEYTSESALANQDTPLTKNELRVLKDYLQRHNNRELEVLKNPPGRDSLYDRLPQASRDKYILQLQEENRAIRRGELPFNDVAAARAKLRSIQAEEAEYPKVVDASGHDESQNLPIAA